VKSRFQSTTRLQCPECRMELLPADYSGQLNHVTCGRCGREIFLDEKKFKTTDCPKCGAKGVEGPCCP